MVEAKGFAEPWDPSGAGVAERGVLVRHLVLPGRVENSLAVLRLLRAEFGAYLPLSVMSQYRPVPACAGRGAFERRVTRGEYARVCDAVGELGFRNVFAQAPDPGDGFLPDFRRAEPFRGNRAVRAPEAGRDG
jgi:putative pyruvate formate lyase activating enzyme